MKFNLVLGGGLYLVLSWVAIAIAGALGVSRFDEHYVLVAAIVRVPFIILIIVALVFSERPARVRRDWRREVLPAEVAETVSTDSTSAERLISRSIAGEFGRVRSLTVQTTPQGLEFWGGTRTLAATVPWEEITEVAPSGRSDLAVRLRPRHPGENHEALLAVQSRTSDLWRGGVALRVQRMSEQINQRRTRHSPQSA